MDSFQASKMLQNTIMDDRSSSMAKSPLHRRLSTKMNVQRSIQLLDEAVRSPGMSTRQRMLRSGDSSLLAPSSLKYDESFRLNASSQKLPSQDNYNSPTASVMLPESTMNKMTEPIDMTYLEDVTTTNVALLLKDNPGVAACEGLYHDFQQCLKQNPSEQQVLVLLLAYIDVCSDQVLLLKKLVKRTSRQQKFKNTFDILDLLHQEKWTWQLVHSLYKDRLEAEVMQQVNDSKDEDMDLDTQGKVIPDEQNIVTRLFERDSILRQSQLVVDWLESCALDGYEMFAENINFFSDQAVGWENTLHVLQNRTKGTDGGGDRALVSELDPDAPIRQNRIMDDLDKEDETRLLQHLFVCIRVGLVDKAQEICQNCGQSWRAASLEGWRLYHDANYKQYGQDGPILPMDGNPYRLIWKLVCWRMAEALDVSQVEKAVYGALSGNLKALLPLCSSWSDYVWAYFKVMVDVKVEQEIHMMDKSDQTTDDLPADYWDRLMEPYHVFKEIEATVDKRIAAEAQTWFRMVQKYIILDDIDALIEVMHGWVRTDHQELPGHLLRFMAHLVLFFRSIGRSRKEELCTAILEAYVEDLIRNCQKHLVAHYVATLPANAQMFWYARFLEGIQDHEERQQCLQLAEEENLDVHLITKTVVENIRTRSSFEHSGDTNYAVETTISEGDRQKIDAIDWLVFDQTQRVEAMKQANAVMRAFIAVKKHLAAREVFDKLPADSVDVIYRIWHAQNGSTILPAADENAIREYMCIKAYLDAVESFNDWFTFVHNAKPSKPSLSVGASFTDYVAYEHQMKQYEMDMERWKHSLMLQTRTTKDRMYNVLLFTDGGWMQDQREEMEPDAGRCHQMKLLRKLHIPAVCLNLHYVLDTSELYAECLQLADYVASEQYHLYNEFDKADLQRFLLRIRQSSLNLLDQNKDPLGYELV